MGSLQRLVVRGFVLGLINMESSSGHFEHDNESRETVSVSQNQLSPLVASYAAAMQRLLDKPDQDHQPTVGVSNGLGMLAFAYEKLRNSVEYREDHVLLRSAIRRILKRRLQAFWNYDPLASALIRELIWARYLPNDAVPQHKVAAIETLLKKYAVLLQAADKQKDTQAWRDWVLGIAACDIEQALVERRASYALAELLYQWLMRHVQVIGLDEGDRAVQLYLAVHRTLLKSDKTLLSYHLFLLNIPEWKKMTEVDAGRVAESLVDWRETIEKQLHHSQAQILARAIKPYTPPFLVLDEVVREQPTTALQRLGDWAYVKSKLDAVCKLRYSQLHSRVRRAIVRSTIYILITKMALALVLEVPFDHYVFGAVHWSQLGANVIVPPLFMAILGLSIKTPSLRNTQVIEDRVKRLLEGDDALETIVLGRAQRSLAAGYSSFYAISNLLIFGGLAWLLWILHFSWLGIGLFVFFMCVVVFFAYRVRQIATEFSVVREKENILEATITFLTLPFLRIGYRLSAEFGKMNVFAFILDVLLEAPFKLMLDLAENWLDFVRQKREEVVETHEY
jgi:hypothetical protein